MNLYELYDLAKDLSKYSDFETKVKQMLTNTPSTAVPPECEVIVVLKIGDNIEFKIES